MNRLTFSRSGFEVKGRALAIGLLAACIHTALPAQSAVAAEETKLSQERIRIGLQPDPALAPIVVALKKGWFEEAGFTEVETQQFTAGVEAGQALVSGNIDIWQPASVPAISMINRGAPVRIVGQGSKCRLESLLVRPDAGVKNPEDLYNTSIAVLQGSTLNAYLGNMARHYGLDFSKLKIVNMTPAESLAALISGGVGAAVTFPPTTGRAMKSIGAIEVAGRTSGFEKDKGTEIEFSKTRCVLVMHQDFLADHPDSAEAALTVIAKAQDYINQPENVEEAQNIFVKWSGQDIADVKEAWSLYKFPIELDEDFNKDLSDYSQFLKETGAIKGDPLPAEELLDLRFHEAAVANIQ